MLLLRSLARCCFKAISCRTTQFMTPECCKLHVHMFHQHSDKESRLHEGRYYRCRHGQSVQESSTSLHGTAAVNCTAALQLAGALPIRKHLKSLI